MQGVLRECDYCRQFLTTDHYPVHWSRAELGSTRCHDCWAKLKKKRDATVPPGSALHFPLVPDKRCHKCDIIKPAEQFVSHCRSLDGLHNRCKVCHNTAQRESTARKRLQSKQTGVIDNENDAYHPGKSATTSLRGPKEKRQEGVRNVQPALRPQRVILKPARLLSPSVKPVSTHLSSRTTFQTREPAKRIGRPFAFRRGAMDTQRPTKRLSPHYRHDLSAPANQGWDPHYDAPSKYITRRHNAPWRACADACTDASDCDQSVSDDSFVRSPSAGSETGLSALADLAALADAERDILLNQPDLPETMLSPNRSQSPRPCSNEGRSKGGPRRQTGLLVRSVSVPLQGNIFLARPTLSRALLGAQASPSRSSTDEPGSKLADVEQVSVLRPSSPVIKQNLPQHPASPVRELTPPRWGIAEAPDLPSGGRLGELGPGPLLTCHGPSVCQPLGSYASQLPQDQPGQGGNLTQAVAVQNPGNDSAVTDQSATIEEPSLSAMLTQLLATQRACFGTVNPAVMMHLMATNACILRKYDGARMRHAGLLTTFFVGCLSECYQQLNNGSLSNLFLLSCRKFDIGASAVFNAEHELATLMLDTRFLS